MVRSKEYIFGRRQTACLIMLKDWSEVPSMPLPIPNNSFLKKPNLPLFAILRAKSFCFILFSCGSPSFQHVKMPCESSKLARSKKLAKSAKRFHMSLASLPGGVLMVMMKLSVKEKRWQNVSEWVKIRGSLSVKLNKAYLCNKPVSNMFRKMRLVGGVSNTRRRPLYQKWFMYHLLMSRTHPAA